MLIVREEKRVVPPPHECCGAGGATAKVNFGSMTNSMVNGSSIRKKEQSPGKIFAVKTFSKSNHLTSIDRHFSPRPKSLVFLPNTLPVADQFPASFADHDNKMQTSRNLSRTLRATTRHCTSSSKQSQPIKTLRSFNSSARYLADGKENPAREHAVDKGSKLDPNIQSYESHQGRKSKEQNAGGTATKQRDDNNSTAKAKKEHPEAPDVVIGMQDERGGKGH